MLSDIARTVAVPLQIRDEQWSDSPGQLTATIYTQDAGTGVGVIPQDALPERVVLVADQLR